MARRSKKASNGKYYKLRREHEEELKSPEYEHFYSILPREWRYCRVIIEEGTKKEADWVIREGDICPYCSKKECSGEIGRNTLRKEIWNAYKRLNPWVEGLLVLEWRTISYQAFHYIKFASGNGPDDLKGNFYFDVYQCYKERNNFYLIERPKSTIQTSYEYQKKFYVDNWVEKNRICPHCGASYNRLVKEQDFKTEGDLVDSTLVEVFRKEIDQAVMVKTDPQDPYPHLKSDISPYSGVYRCKTCRRIFAIMPEEGRFFNYKIFVR